MGSPPTPNFTIIGATCPCRAKSFKTTQLEYRRLPCCKSY